MYKYAPTSQRQVSSQSHLSHAGHNAHSSVLLVLIFFEHLVTTDREIDLFWKHKFSGAVALFFANRYLLLVVSVLSLVTAFDTSVSAEVSQVNSHASDFIRTNIFVPPRCELCFSYPLVLPQVMSTGIPGVTGYNGHMVLRASPPTCLWQVCDT